MQGAGEIGEVALELLGVDHWRFHKAMILMPSYSFSYCRNTNAISFSPLDIVWSASPPTLSSRHLDISIDLSDMPVQTPGFSKHFLALFSASF
jgi:hypothetical protein